MNSLRLSLPLSPSLLSDTVGLGLRKDSTYGHHIKYTVSGHLFNTWGNQVIKRLTSSSSHIAVAVRSCSADLGLEAVVSINS